MSGGPEDRALAGARYGGRIGERTYYRVFEPYVNRDASWQPNEQDFDWIEATKELRKAGVKHPHLTRDVLGGVPAV